ncbi:hypothetical protein ACMFMG_005422 [Clarireedia jacksonii]
MPTFTSDPAFAGEKHEDFFGTNPEDFPSLKDDFTSIVAEEQSAFSGIHYYTHGPHQPLKTLSPTQEMDWTLLTQGSNPYPDHYFFDTRADCMTPISREDCALESRGSSHILDTRMLLTPCPYPCESCADSECLQPFLHHENYRGRSTEGHVSENKGKDEAEKAKMHNRYFYSGANGLCSNTRAHSRLPSATHSMPPLFSKSQDADANADLWKCNLRRWSYVARCLSVLVLKDSREKNPEDGQSD